MAEYQAHRGPFLALLSAALFGVSPVLAKLIIGEMSPVLLAGLLYLGSGVALLCVAWVQKRYLWIELRGLSRAHRWKLAGATVAGGILAPLCLTYGIQSGSAFEVSLLLNLESVTTTVIAWLVFREHVGRLVWIGKLLLVAGGIVMSLNFSVGIGISTSGLWIFAACMLWGVDNNVTRDIEELSPAVLGSIKGLIAGGFNIVLALVLGQVLFSGGAWTGALLIGAVSYGVSLVLFIEALRLIGASRTSTWFAIGPFFGMVGAVVFLGDRPHPYQWGAAVIMVAGLWVLHRETHSHLHMHQPMTHRHKHSHDEHHQHGHADDESGALHEHLHTHEATEHTHAHFPDIHHRHEHKD